MRINQTRHQEQSPAIDDSGWTLGHIGVALLRDPLNLVTGNDNRAVCLESSVFNIHDRDPVYNKG